MARSDTPGYRRRPRRWPAAALLSAVGLLLPVASVSLAGAAVRALPTGKAPAPPAPSLPAETPSWCSTHGSSLAAWTTSQPNLPICGPGPDYGGSWDYVDLPGPDGVVDGYYNATPGFQCVELAERWLAVGEGLAPIEAEGSSVAENYHGVYPNTTLVIDGTPGAVGHSPVAGDVVSFSTVSDFADPTDGHVAIVVRSSVDPATGDGTVLVAQQNVSPSDYLKTLDVVDWHLSDPMDPADAEFQYPYAAWLHVVAPPATANGVSANAKASLASATTPPAHGATLVVHKAVAVLTGILLPTTNSSPLGLVAVTPPVLRAGLDSTVEGPVLVSSPESGS